MFDDREERRDAAPGGKRKVMLAIGRIVCDVEAAVRRRDGKRRAGNERFVRPRREAAVGNAFDGNAQFAVRGRRADRIGAAHALAVDVRFDREELALCEAETFPQFGRNVEGYHDRFARLRAHGSDPQVRKRARRGRSLRRLSEL